VAGESAFDRSLMAKAAGQVETALGEIRSNQSRLSSAHDSLMGGWQGPAASAFTGAFSSFNADFTKVIQALDNLQQKLVASRTNYNTVEEANQTSASRIASALNR
jgi:WXG100 family type VII secretion target